MPSVNEVIKALSSHRPTLACTVKDWRRLNEGGDYTWLGDPLPQELARELYPEREYLDVEGLSASERAQALKAYEKEHEDADAKHMAVAHFQGVDVDEADDGTPGFRVHVGDYLRVGLDDKGEGIGQVVELFQDPLGNHRFVVRWFYSIQDEEVKLLVESKGRAQRGAQHGERSLGGLEGFDRHHLWRAKEKDASAYCTEFDMASMVARVEVTQVRPGEQPPTDGSYWWDLECGRVCFSFENPVDEDPLSKEQYKDQKRLLRVMDLYAGGGGFGYLDTRTDRVEIRTDWAVDYVPDMAATFKCNFQHAHVFTSGIDEILALFQEVKRLCDALGVGGKGDYNPKNEEAFAYQALGRCNDDKLVAQPRSLVMEYRCRGSSKGNKPKTSDAPEAAAAAAAVEVEGEDDGEEGGKEGAGPSRKKRAKEEEKDIEAEAAEIEWPEVDRRPSSREVAELLQVRLCEKAPRASNKVAAGQLVRFIEASERRLEFKVRWANGDEDSWLPESALSNCNAQLAEFCKKLRRNQAIPFPGEVNLICGGPPCQGVSGNNRHATMTDILKDVRNRQLLVYLAMVDWFQPNFVLMENVQDIMKKEDGAYVKYALGTMLEKNYQIRLGVLAAGDFGNPQGRWRCFMWGAKREEQLPAYPQSTHNCRDFDTPVCKLGKMCQGGFLSREAMQEAYDAVLLGDTLTDLPPVGNGELLEELAYEAAPLYYHQAFLRREPKPWQTSTADRLAFRKEYMGESQRQLNRDLLKMAEKQGVMALGKASMNNKNPLVPCKGKNGKGTRKRADGADAGNHVFETLDSALNTMAGQDPALADMMRLQLQASRMSYMHERGREFKGELEQYFEAIERGEDEEAILTDHRPLTLNDDDHLRVCRVPHRTDLDKDSNFRDMEGCVTNPDDTCCYGSQHAALVDGRTQCQGGGHFSRSKKSSNHHESRVDQMDKDGWRGVSLEGCPAYTRFLPTMDAEVPRWCITYKNGKSKGRHGGYGRVHLAQIITTVVGRSEPHNLELAHPTQNRVLTIRENARAQGFPDYHMFVASTGLASTGRSSKRWVRNTSLVERYQMIGNAVCPAVAAALGRCLALAAVGESPPGEEFIDAPNPEYDEIVAQAQAEGLTSYYDEYTSEHGPVIRLEGRYCALFAAYGGGKGGELSEAEEEDTSEDEDADEDEENESEEEDE